MRTRNKDTDRKKDVPIVVLKIAMNSFTTTDKKINPRE
jgi:hypothetical protein